MDQSSVDRDPIEKLADSFVARFRAGERPSIEEYAAKYPELADEIRDLLPALVMIEQDMSVVGEPTGSFSGQTLQPGSAPRQLGDYLILREIGRGGMGVVYEALQQSLGRHVALKVLPWQAVGKGSRLDRFRLEARSAARLHHSNIVPVYGVGEHSGTHYYAMQYIQGQGLDAVFEELRKLRDGRGSILKGEIDKTEGDSRGAAATIAHSLMTGRFRDEDADDPSNRTIADDPRDSATNASINMSISGSEEVSTASILSGRGDLTRSESGYVRGVARIGLQVAEALAYAHGQGILHRDIKPSNLLLDATGTVWITDFGLAKSEGSEGPTETGDFVGTLRYMAPERFDGWSDRRGDVYSLGVSLYEFLTLNPLYEEPNRARLIERIINEEPAPPRRLDRRIPRDLETIVLKAIAKEPSQRYVGADQLADDLRRFLADEPIRARRVGALELAWRWGRRNPALSGLAASLVMVFLVGFALVTYQWRRAEKLRERSDMFYFKSERERIEAERQRVLAERQRSRAEEQRKIADEQSRLALAQRSLAEENFGRARAAVDDYFTKVSESRLLAVAGLQPLRKDLLTSALQFYDDFIKRRGDDPSLRSALASIRLKVGKIHGELGQKKDAEEAYRAALALYETLARENPADVEVREGLAEACLQVALYDQKMISDDSLILEAIAIRKDLVAANPTDVHRREALARSYQALADRELARGGIEIALGDFLQARDIAATLVRDHPENPDYQHALGRNLGQIADALCRLGRHADETIVRPLAIEHIKTAYEKAPNVVEHGIRLVYLESREGNNSSSQGRKDDAVRHYTSALELAERLARDNPAVPEIKRRWIEAIERFISDINTGLFGDRSKLIDRIVAGIDALPATDADDLFQKARLLAQLAAPQAGPKYKPTALEKEMDLKNADRAVATLKSAIDAGYLDNSRAIDLPIDHNPINNPDSFQSLRSRDDFKALVKRSQQRSKLKQTTSSVKIASPGAAAERVKEANPPRAMIGEQARHQSDLAASQHAIGLIQLSLGYTDDAIKSFEQVVAIRSSMLKDDPKNGELRADYAAILFSLAQAQWQSMAGKSAEWVRSSQKILEILRVAVIENPDDKGLKLKISAVLRNCYEVYAKDRLWREAIRYLAESVALDPTDNGKTYRLAPLLLYAGDIAGYHRLRSDFLARFADTNDPREAQQTAKACLLLPIDGPELERIERLADRAMADEKQDQIANGLLAKGMAEYRKGRFQESERYVEKSLARNSDWSIQTPAKYVLAMARYRQGQVDRARKTLADNDSYINSIHKNRSRLPEPFKEQDLKDWLIGLIFQREAHELIDGRPFPEFWGDLLHRGELYIKLGMNEAAEAEFQAAIAAHPADALIRAECDRIRADSGKKTIVKGDTAVSSSVRRDEFREWFARGRVHDRLGQREAAAADFTKAAEFVKAIHAEKFNADDLIVMLRTLATNGRVDLVRSLLDERPQANSSNVHILTPLPPQLEGTLKSSVGNPGTIRFLNLTNRVVRIEWLNHRGKRQLYKTIAPWGEHTTETYSSHIWLVVDEAGKSAAIYIAKPGVCLGVITEDLWIKGVETPADPEDSLVISQSLIDRGDRKRGDDVIAKAIAELSSEPQRLGPVGSRLGRSKRWNAAAAVYSKLSKLHPYDHWYRTLEAPLRLQIGDIAGYRQICREMLAKFAYASDPDIVERTIKTCALAPDAVDDVKLIQDLSDKLITKSETLPNSSWFLLAGCMADYRGGRFDHAVERFKMIDPGEADRRPMIHATAFPILAMANQKLGKYAEARAALESAKTRLAAGRKRMELGESDSAGYWHDWLTAEILYREAEGLILDADFPADPFMR